MPPRNDNFSNRKQKQEKKYFNQSDQSLRQWLNNGSYDHDLKFQYVNYAIDQAIAHKANKYINSRDLRDKGNSTKTSHSSQHIQSLLKKSE